MSPLASAMVLPCSRARQSASSSYVAADELEELHQHARAALRVGGRPGRLRRLGVLDRGAHLGLGGQRAPAARTVAVHRLEDVAEAARRALHVLAADEMRSALPAWRWTLALS